MTIDQAANVIHSEEVSRKGDGFIIKKHLVVTKEMVCEEECFVTRTEVILERRGNGSITLTLSKLRSYSKFLEDLPLELSPADLDQARDDMAEDAAELRRRAMLAVPQ